MIRFPNLILFGIAPIYKIEFIGKIYVILLLNLFLKIILVTLFGIAPCSMSLLIFWLKYIYI